MTSSFEYAALPVSTDTAFPPAVRTTRRVAAAAPPPLHVVTPLLPADILGRRVLLKLDNLQPSRSFKLRGIGHLCQHHAARGVTRFVCSSAGNAGYAVAWAGRALGIAVTVVVPACTPEFVRRRIAALGAEVRSVGTVWDEANTAALELAAQPGCAFIPPFDHPLLWQGHASLVDELVQQCEAPPDAILLAVGGGGLLLGVLEGLRRVGWQHTRVFAVEPERAAALGPSLLSGNIVELSQPRSVATSLCVRRLAPSLISACRDRPVTALTVSDAEATQACVHLAEDQGLMVEPACGAALAPLYASHPALADAQRVVAIVCGGMVVTLDQLAQWRHAAEDAPTALG
ncbi:pyridoxal-phosphate dependent enzyme [Arenimonas oryziterrae]|uniref:L-serine ammonia-lyase n=1 Tax=Arenimonas oryziterrae DSM 21050 = YC6267 TaxID=1121015 RepID=A0A091B143_9GAMM|nr:pyridoxal-phosphate dependent enzyme [Arenimonas oryziterrae]KFN44589.1 hypothetical protein N789_00855 [Arenimonas oryziterrae DSM 21050 = YC6267]